MKSKRMKSINKLIFLIMVSSILVACGNAPRKAPIEDRVTRQNRKTDEQPFSSAKAHDQSYYIVKKGDTLYRIAMEKGQSYGDLIAWNNLANPNDIKVGKALRVAPPETGTSAVTSPTGIDARPLGSSNTAIAPSSNNKNGPRADKKPYSVAALTELQKTGTTNVASENVVDKSGEKVAEKVAEKPEEIVWMWPAEGKISTNFADSKNKGVDFLGKLGQNIYAAAAGTVMYAGSGIRGYGNLVIIKHSNNFLSAYAHNQSILVKEKQVITKGQKIAEMGNSDSDVVKLHFEIRQQGKPVDPTKFLPGR